VEGNISSEPGPNNTYGGLGSGETGQFTLTETSNLAYISANAILTIGDLTQNTAYFEVVSIAGSSIVIKNISDYRAYWMPNTPVALVGPKGPTGSCYFTRDSNNNITYTEGTTTLSRVIVNNVDYNKLPMGLLKQYTMESSSTNALISYDDFPVNSASYLVGTVNFTAIGPTGPRNVRTHINLNVAESGTSTAWRDMYLTLYDDSTAVNRFKKHYRESEYTDTLNFYHYASIDAGTSKTYKLYATSNSGTNGGLSTLHISAGVGGYTGMTAPPSYITVEDMGYGHG
jgi:hypothetical protein